VTWDFIGPLTRCRSRLTGMVATRGGYRWPAVGPDKHRRPGLSIVWLLSTNSSTPAATGVLTLGNPVGPRRPGWSCRRGRTARLPTAEAAHAAAARWVCTRLVAYTACPVILQQPAASSQQPAASRRQEPISMSSRRSGQLASSLRQMPQIGTICLRDDKSPRGGYTGSGHRTSFR
jgi:hypothetical protein